MPIEHNAYPQHDGKLQSLTFPGEDKRKWTTGAVDSQEDIDFGEASAPEEIWITAGTVFINGLLFVKGQICHIKKGDPIKFSGKGAYICIAGEIPKS